MHYRQPTNEQTQRFGYWIIIIGICCSLGLWFKGCGWQAPSLASFCAALGVCCLRAPNAGKKLHIVWLRAAALAGSLITPIVLTVLFYGVVFPLSLLLKACGHDALCLKDRRSSVQSYWIDAARASPNLSDYERQS